MGSRLCTFQSIMRKLSEEELDEMACFENIFNLNKETVNITLDTSFELGFSSKEDCIKKEILNSINIAATVRPKDRRLLVQLFENVNKVFAIDIKELKLTLPMRNMLQAENIIPEDEKTYHEIFEFGAEGTYKRAIFEDNIELLTTLMYSIDTSAKIGCEYFIDQELFDNKNKLSLIEACAYFGSNKCFKFILMNVDEADEDTCQYAIAGGNIEIIDTLKSKNFKFQNCLFIGIAFHRQDCFEWLIKQNPRELVCFIQCLSYYNEPAFYYYVLNKIDINRRYGSKLTNLHTILVCMRPKFVEILIKQGADIDAVDNRGKTPLFMVRNDKMAKVLIDYGADVNKQDNQGKIALHDTARFGFEKATEELIRSESDINKQDKQGRTALHYAAEQGNTNVVELLLNNDADPSIKDKAGNTALHLAVTNDHKDAVVHLAHDNKDIDATNNKNMTPLQLAAKFSGKEIIKILIDEGAKIIGYQDNQPTLLALNSNNFDALYILLQANAELDDSKLNKLVAVSAKNGRFDIIKLCSNKNNCFDAQYHAYYNEEEETDEDESDTEYVCGGSSCKNSSSSNSKSGCSSRRSSSSTSKKEKEAETETKEDKKHGDDDSDLSIVDSESDESSLSDFLDTHYPEYEYNHVDKDEGKTALHFASEKGDVETVIFLLRNGASSSITDESGKTALHYACKNGSIDIVEMLIERGADVNVKDKNGMTPIFFAANVEIAKDLVDQGAQYALSDKNKKSPLFYAMRNNKPDVESFLRELGNE